MIIKVKILITNITFYCNFEDSVYFVTIRQLNLLAVRLNFMGLR